METTEICVSHVRKSFGKKPVLLDINLRIAGGTQVVIAGKNGCGKSTLLQILAGVLRMDGGALSYFGLDPVRDRSVFEKLCGYVPQDNPLMEELTVFDNLRLWGLRKKQMDDAVLEQFGLKDLLTMRINRLSGGMKRRVSLACATLSHPRVLFLDEPSNALDISYRTQLHEWLALYKSRGGIVLMTSHDQAEITGADVCLYMSGGRLYGIPQGERELSRLVTLSEEQLDEKYGVCPGV